MLRLTAALLILLGAVSSCFAEERESTFRAFELSYDIEEETSDWLTVRGQDEDSGGADPSDPTQIVFHVMTEFEWNKLSGGEGDQVALKVAPFIPLEFAGEKFLFNFEVPVPMYS